MGVIDQLSKDEQRIWHTYLCQARRLTRRSVNALNTLEPQIQLKSAETDDELQCCRESEPATFYESISSVVFSVFAAEFRINLAARMKDVDIYDKRMSDYFDEQEALIKSPTGKEREFGSLSHYQKWRNFPRACGRLETKQYLDSVRKLGRWITMRNDIVHAKHRKLAKSLITPQHALDCYESVVDSIFELNILLYNGRKSNEESKREVSLMP